MPAIQWSMIILVQCVFSIDRAFQSCQSICINHERMPMLLTEEREFETWLSGTPDEAVSLLQPARTGVDELAGGVRPSSG